MSHGRSGIVSKWRGGLIILVWLKHSLLFSLNQQLLHGLSQAN